MPDRQIGDNCESQLQEPAQIFKFLLEHLEGSATTDDQ